MRLVSLIVAFVASGTLAVYVLTCSVNNTPMAPVHPIVGKWRMEMFCDRSTAGSNEVILCQFKADGSYEVNTFRVGEKTERVVGNYEIDRDATSMKLTTNVMQTAASRPKLSRLELSDSNRRMIIKSDASNQIEIWFLVKS